MKVLDFGSFNLDHIYSVAEFVKPGETISSLSVETVLGGKGFNQAMAAARAGLPVYAAGNIGADGACFQEKCRENGIDPHLITVREEATGSAIIQVNSHGENCIILHGGANQCVTREQVCAVLDEFAPGDVLLLQNEVNELAFIIDEAFRRGLRIVLNPSPMNEKITVDMLAKAEWIFVNETEAERICGEKDPALCLEKLAALCPRSRIVLTLGADGSCYKDAAVTARQKAFSVDVVDTTAAGDTFTGYFLAAYLENGDAAAALELASKASAVAVSRKGAFNSIPFRREVI